jgi:hypothetical protein
MCLVQEFTEKETEFTKCCVEVEMMRDVATVGLFEP